MKRNTHNMEDTMEFDSNVRETELYAYLCEYFEDGGELETVIQLAQEAHSALEEIRS
jgi:hypothetical protein